MVPMLSVTEFRAHFAAKCEVKSSIKCLCGTSALFELFEIHAPAVYGWSRNLSGHLVIHRPRLISESFLDFHVDLIAHACMVMTGITCPLSSTPYVAI